MRKLCIPSLAALMLATSAWAYTAEKAEANDRFFSSFTQKACADSKLFVKAEEVMQMLGKGEKFMLLDIRTPGETGVIALATDNAVAIPLEHLFEKANLDGLPTDRPIVVVCYSGARASMAAVGLLQSGIKNVRVLKGGIVALAGANSVKNAPMKDAK